MVVAAAVAAAAVAAAAVAVVVAAAAAVVVVADVIPLVTAYPLVTAPILLGRGPCQFPLLPPPLLPPPPPPMRLRAMSAVMRMPVVAVV